MKMSESELDELPDRQTFVIFGVNYAKIECFRQSMLNGFATAFAGGIGTFFCTSKMKTTVHATFASFWIGAWATWFYCRYNRYKRQQMWEKIRNDQKDKNPMVGDYFVPRTSTYKTPENAVEDPAGKLKK